MADDLYSQPNYSPLFDLMKGRNETENSKELNEQQSGLRMQENEQGAKFNQILESMRSANISARAAEEFQRNTAQKALEGRGLADYVGDQAIAQAGKGNVIDSLVQKGETSPEFQMSTGQPAPYSAKPISPYAAGAAHSDLQAGIQSHLTNQLETQRFETQQRFTRDLDRLDDTDISQARAMAPLLDQYGLKLMSQQFANLQPGSMGKKEFQAAISQADNHMQTVNQRLQSSRTFAQARVQSAEIAAKAKLDVAKLRENQKLGDKELQQIREHRQQLNNEIQSTRSSMQMNIQMLNSVTTGVERQHYQGEYEKDKAQLSNLQNLQAQMGGLEQKALMTPQPAGRAATAEFQAEFGKAITEVLGKENINPAAEWPKMKPAMQQKVWDLLRQRGLGPKQQTPGAVKG